MWAYAVNLIASGAYRNTVGGEKRVDSELFVAEQSICGYKDRGRTEKEMQTERNPISRRANGIGEYKTVEKKLKERGEGLCSFISSSDEECSRYMCRPGTPSRTVGAVVSVRICQKTQFAAAAAEEARKSNKPQSGRMAISSIVSPLLCICCRRLIFSYCSSGSAV